MRYPKEQKEQTRQRILDAASRLFREHGYDGVGIDAIMAEVGLTAGGFYAHFPSKDALFAAALARAFDARPDIHRSTGAGKDEEFLTSFIFSYLSRTHKAKTAEGCIFPALTADVVRGSKETRASYEELLRQFLTTIETHLSTGKGSERERALSIIVQLIGGVLLARAVPDENLSNEILKACRQTALKLSSS